MNSSEPADAPAGWHELLSGEHLPRVLLLSLALWLHASNSMLTGTTLPAAVDEIGGVHLISWAFSLYLLGSIVAGASINLAVDRYGLKSMMIATALLYLLGSLVCSAAANMPVFLVGRSLQGIGGGGLVALVYIFQSRVFPNRLLPRLVGCMSMVWMIASFSGPLIGGTFASLGIWRVAFVVFSIKAIFLVYMITRLVPGDIDFATRAGGRIPVINIGLLASSVLLVSLASASYQPLRSEMLVAVGVLALLGYVLRDAKSGTERMLPTGVTSLHHPLGAGLLMTFALNASMMSFLVYGPLLLIRLYDLTPLTAGLVLMTETVAWSVSAIVFSGVSQRHDPLMILLGSAMVTLGLVGQALVVPATSVSLIVMVLFISSGGFGMIWGHVIRRISASATPEEQGKASSAIPVIQQLGFAMGAAFVGVLANGQGLESTGNTAELVELTPWLFLGFLPLALLGNYCAIAFVRR